MPGPVDHEPRGEAPPDGIGALLEEQRRLRGEIENLRRQQEQLLKEKKEQEPGKGEKKEDGKQEGPDQKAGDQKDEKKDPPKPPLRQRASAWVHAHPLATILLIVGTVVLLVAGYLVWQYLQSYVSTDDAEVDGHTHQIGSRISGTVTGVYIEDDRTVVKGQTLVDLDPSDYETALSRAQANLAQALSELQAQAPNVPITQTTEATNVATANLEIANAEAALQASNQGYVSALADLKQSEATAANAALEEQRYRRLADKQEVSRELYNQRATEARSQTALVASRRAAAEAAEKTVKQREAALAQVRDRARAATTNEPRQIAVQHATVAGRRANVEAAKAQVEQARLNLSYCKIAAPVSGIIGNKTVEVGQQVAPGQELLAITSTDDIWITANFKETQITNMHPGQRVTVSVDALNLQFEGWVQNLPGATGAKYSLLPPENATGNYVKVVQRLPVRIRLKPGQQGSERLRPGMSAEPKVWVK